ncbi:CPBP family intramembrane metalloprotease [Candidatus Parcubacteria bacterium]|nr:MAG: CPBP family intramembrane metalloprotease [Candidatus Parcubacteria bacterium]
MKAIIEFCAIFAVGILNHVMGAFFYFVRSDYEQIFSPTENLLRLWWASLSGISVVLLVAINQPEGLASVGIVASDATPLFVGIVSISLIVLFLGGVQGLINYFLRPSPENKTLLSNPVAKRVAQYQNKLGKSAYLTVLPFAVASEELIYRGYLVLMLGRRTHTYLPWVILSVALSVIIHLYQGRSVTNVLYYAIFALCFIGLAVWTGNIMTPIVAHLYYDLMWTFGVWEKATVQLVNHRHSKSKSFLYLVLIVVNLLLLLVMLSWMISFAN